jgi:hypothetical protein
VQAELTCWQADEFPPRHSLDKLLHSCSKEVQFFVPFFAPSSAAATPTPAAAPANPTINPVWLGLP